MIVKTSMIATIALAASAAAGQTVLRVDASAPVPAVVSGYLKTGTSTGPGGTLAINNRYITRDGRPWIPVMGEFHFSRYPAAEWEDELLKMKASGVEVVASYVIWNQLETAPGKLDWTDNRDIRRFVQLCAKHGLLFFARPGPWVHGETRFGGIPDWVVARTRSRTNDPLYMAEVARFWGELGGQLQGLMWKDGGPIIGVQLENEYVHTGKGRGADHIAALRALAVRSGMDVPLYTVTGWGRAAYPRGAVAPVVGAYPDEPWGIATTKSPPVEGFMFRFGSRVDGTLGAQAVGVGTGVADIDKDLDLTPFLGAEYGPGVPIMYRRRPIIATDDIGATVTTQIGSGLNLLGYYMYHGGRNPLVAGRTLEETTRSGGYNDMPIMSYDFQSPLGVYGEVGPVSATIRPLHAFLTAFGDRLAPMTVRRPAVVPTATDDLVTPRFAVRSAGDSGFLFVNNHVRQHDMATQRQVQFEVALPGSILRFPSKPVDVADHDYFIWPFDFDLDGIRLSWASAQPVTRLQDAQGPLYVFKTTDGIAPEFAFEAAGIDRLSAPARRDGDRLIVDAFKPSARRLLTVRAKNGRTTRIMLLSDADAKRAWVGDIAGARRMVLTDAALFTSGDTLVLRQRDRTAFRFAIWPAVTGLKGSVPLRDVGDGSSAYEARTPPGSLPEVRPVKARNAEDAPPIRTVGSPPVALAPVPEAYAASAAWTFTLPRTVLDGGVDTWLTIDYRGDVARLFRDNDLLDDAFWDGRRWTIGLKRFAADLGKPWTLTIMPLRADAPIYLVEGVKRPPAGEQVAALDGITLEREYEVRVTLPAATPR